MNEIVDRFYQVHSIRQNVKSAHMSPSNLHYEPVLARGWRGGVTIREMLLQNTPQTTGKQQQ